MRLLVATRSEGKMREIRRVFNSTSIELVSLTDLGIESNDAEEELEVHSSFSENAFAKAQYFHQLTGLPTLADDSGLVVDALGGEPGVRSKRYASPAQQAEQGVDRANILELLRRLEGVGDLERAAHFHCSMAIVLPEAEELFDGRVDGVILNEPRGDGGFGYDPLFLLPERGLTTAQLAPDEKNEVSHRGRAAREARDWLMSLLETARGLER